VVTSHWQMPPEVEPPPHLIEAAIKPGCIGPSASSSGGYNPITTVGIRVCSGPQALADFDVLDLSNSGSGLHPAQILAYPRNYCQLVSSEDCVPWAMQQGSGRRHWGSHGRRGEDDRVMLTLACGEISLSREVGLAAHWFDHRGDERSMPSVSCWPGEHAWCETYLNQTFVVRAYPKQQLALCGIKITGRPYDTSGKSLVLLVPKSVDTSELFAWCHKILASLPEDSREPPEQTQGGRPAPPPPSSKNKRGPWG